MRRTGVIVDLTRCQVYGQCVFAAPDVFRLRGADSLEFDPVPAEAERDRILRAARACPVQAISVGWIEDEDEPDRTG